MSDVVHTCLDRSLPAEEQIAAAEAAIREDPRNAPTAQEGMGTLELAVETGKLWKNGRTLTIAFLDGHDEVRARVEEIAIEWCEYANLTFDFGNHAEAQIRISFKESGSWSWVGTDALSIAADKPSMNFGWLTPDASDDAYNRVVLHEFGHALGCIHEHQTPAGGIPWDEEKLYAHYAAPPTNWNKKTTYRNLLQRYSATTTQYTEFDPESIMLYPIPKELTVGGFEVGWNTRLSPTDKEMIGKMYPRSS